MTDTLYISIDIEADGPIPGVYSMLSLGAAAFRRGGPVERIPLKTFKRNLLPLPEARQDPETMAWWKTQPDAWKATTEGAIDPAVALQDFAEWLRHWNPRDLVIVGYPVTFDFQWVYWYWWKFIGVKPPFGFQGLDIKTLAMTAIRCEYKQATKRNMPKKWFEGAPKHTHDALDDAIGQGILFLNILKHLDDEYDQWA